MQQINEDVKRLIERTTPKNNPLQPTVKGHPRSCSANSADAATSVEVLGLQKIPAKTAKDFDFRASKTK